MIIFKEPKVMDCFLGSLISAGANLIGGILGNKQSEKNTSLSNTAMARQAALDRQYQKEFAQHGVSWKAADARSSGLDPLAAMGSSTFYSPVAQPVKTAGSDYSFLSKMGQNLGTAAERFLSREQIQNKRELDQLALERAHLENDYLQMRNMEKNKQVLNYPSQVAVPAPSDHSQVIQGQGDSVNVVPDQVVRHQGGHKAGVHAMKQYRLGAPDRNGRMPVYSAIEQEAGDAMDADLPTKARYNAREWSKVVRSWAGSTPKRKPPIKKKGYHLEWNRTYAQWEMVPNKPGNSRSVKIRRRIDVPRDKKNLRNPTFKRYKIFN